MNYTALRDNLVLVKIEEYGKAVSLRRAGTTTGWTKSYESTTGRYKWTEVADPTHSVYADPASVPYDVAGHAIETRYENKEIDGTTIKAGDRRFKTADLPTPTTSDKLVVGSQVLTVINVRTYAPGEVTLLWELQCRS
jgi:hypothetical protein